MGWEVNAVKIYMFCAKKKTKLKSEHHISDVAYPDWKHHLFGESQQAKGDPNSLLGGVPNARFQILYLVIRFLKNKLTNTNISCVKLIPSIPS